MPTLDDFTEEDFKDPQDFTEDDFGPTPSQIAAKRARDEIRADLKKQMQSARREGAMGEFGQNVVTALQNTAEIAANPIGALTRTVAVPLNAASRAAGGPQIASEYKGVDLEGITKTPLQIMEEGLRLPPGALSGPESPVGGVAESAEQTAAGLVEPRSLALLPLFGPGASAAAPVATTLGRTLLGAEMLPGVPEAAKRATEALTDPTVSKAEAAKAAADYLTNFGMTAAISAHAVPGAKGPTPPSAEAAAIERAAAAGGKPIVEQPPKFPGFINVDGVMIPEAEARKTPAPEVKPEAPKARPNQSAEMFGSLTDEHLEQLADYADLEAERISRGKSKTDRKGLISQPFGEKLGVTDLNALQEGMKDPSAVAAAARATLEKRKAEGIRTPGPEETKPEVLLTPDKIAKDLGLVGGKENATGLWEFDVRDPKDGQPIRFSVKKGSTPEEVKAKAESKLAEFADSTPLGETETPEAETKSPEAETPQAEAERVAKMSPEEFEKFSPTGTATAKAYDLAVRMGVDADRSKLVDAEKAIVAEQEALRPKMAEAFRVKKEGELPTTPEEQSRLFKQSQILNAKKQYFNEALRMLTALDNVKAGKSFAEAAKAPGILPDELEKFAEKAKIKPKTEAPPEPAKAPEPPLEESEPPKAAKTLSQKMFDKETEANGPDILSWMKDNMRMLSKSAARRKWGKDKFKLNASLWDDSVKLSKPHHGMAIYSPAGSGPDVIADAAYRAGQLSEPSVNLLWQEIQKASKARGATFERIARDQRIMDDQIKMLEDWQETTKQGKVPVVVNTLSVGDLLEAGGEQLKVTAVDPDTGQVTVQGGKRFGKQLLEDDQTIHVDKLERAPEGGDFLPPDEEATKPKPPEEPPFTLIQETAQAARPPKPKTTQGDLFGEPEPETPEPKPAEAPAEKTKVEPRPLTKPEQREFVKLSEKARANREKGGPPLTAVEAARYDHLTRLAGQDEMFRTSRSTDAFERARRGEDAAFDDLDEQLRNTYPEPEELEIGRPNPNQIFTPKAFVEMFNKAFAARDFDTILDAIKATSDVSVWKPFMKEVFRKQSEGDAVAAKKVEWFRHVFNGTRPDDAIPRPQKPPPKASAPPPPRPGPRPGPGPGPRPGGAGTGPRPGASAPPPKPPPKPPAPPPQRIAVDPLPGGGAKSPYKIIEDFSKAIGKAIRVMRMKPGVLGTYRPGTTGVAERFAGDLDTAAHELAGHWTDDKYGIGKPWIKPRTASPYDAELAKFWIHGSVTPRSPLWYRRAEGIAEFIRAYVVNPKQAVADAPKFAAYFKKTLPPEALSAIEAFSKDVRTWAGEDPIVRAGLSIRMEPPTLTERLWNGIRGRGFGFEVNKIDQLRQWFDDPYHYAMKAFRQVQQIRGGLPLKPEQNFELVARLLSTHDSRMSDQFERGLVPMRPKQVRNAKGRLEVERLIDPVTKQPMSMKWLLGSLDDLSKHNMESDMRDASALMVAQRTLEKSKQLGRKSNISGIGAGIMTDVQAAAELIDRLEQQPARYARLKEAARRYRLWADKNIQMLVDAGRITPDAAARIRQSNEYYVDMHRLSSDFETGNRAQRGVKIGTSRDKLKRMIGSSLEINNVYSNLLEQTDSIQKEAHRNVVMNTFVDGLRNLRKLYGPDLRDFDQFGTLATSADRNTIKVYNGGHLEHWKFEPDIYESLKGLGEMGTHAFIDIAAMPSRFARYMITHGPQFMLRNPVRDTFERSVNSRNASKPWDILQGYTQEDLSRYEVFGGGQFGNYIVDKHVWNRELKRTVRELTKDPTNILLSPLKLKHAWEQLAEKSEKLGRVAEFRRAFDAGKAKGYDDYNAALYAAGEARGLLDFAKAGTVMRVINRLIPFSNARLRGLARATFAARENPARFAMRWGMFVLAPTLAVMMWNRRDKKTWEEYQQQPAYLRDFFWSFKVGPYWLRVPKPHELGVMAGGVERAIDRMMGDKKALEGYGGSAASAALPIQNPVEGTGPLKTGIELYLNRDTFRDRDIVPIWERDLNLDLRKGTVHASKAGQGIAHAINLTGMTVDPRQMDYILQSYGGLGQSLTDLTRKDASTGTAALKGTGYVVEPPGSSARDVQWVIDWARHHGKTSTKEIRELQDMRKAIYDTKDIGARSRRAAELRAYAIRLRKEIESGAGF